MTLSQFSPSKPPKNLCILRLSALGDITHSLPVLRTLQKNWPDTAITWIIGKTEYQLVKDIEGVEFITFDKSQGLAAYKAIRQQLKGRHFDILLHMQLSIRASAISYFVSADIKLGFDKERAKDFQWLFSDQKIQPASTRQHVVDSFMEFTSYFGLKPVMEWDLPVAAEASKGLQHKLDKNDQKKLLVINPCAVAKSRDWRDWTAECYAAVADYAQQKLDMKVVLCGGSSSREQNVASTIFSLCREKPVNLVGQTSIAELVALLDQASVVIAPDTGPTHIANALNTPVIGLYAATNPQRAGPYRFQHLVVNHYPEALEKYYELSIGDAAWGQRIQNAEAMGLIKADEVINKLEKVVESF
ncbi:MAG: glycosyltransferase family 9 protein [Gammaproteobacteria bacterium]|nr:glycosyltransferase family 9 protein [Gammaproteobacteria bacterium]